MTKHLLDLHRVDELKNFVANNLLSQWVIQFLAYQVVSKQAHSD